MGAAINERLLEEKLEALEKTRPWSARVISKLESLIRSGEDLQVFRINPIRFAAQRNIPEQDSIDLFLHGTAAGVFQMNWHLVCPSCGDSVESFRTLNNLNSHFYCSVCQRNTEATLDDYIHITFTISPQIRDIVYNYPDSLPVEDFYFKYHFNDGAAYAGGPRKKRSASK